MQVHLSHWCNPRAYFADLGVDLLPSQLNIIWAWKKILKTYPLKFVMVLFKHFPIALLHFFWHWTRLIYTFVTLSLRKTKKFLNFICYFLHVLCFMKRILHRWLVKYSILHSLSCWQKEKYNIFLQITNLYIIF